MYLNVVDNDSKHQKKSSTEKLAWNIAKDDYCSQFRKLLLYSIVYKTYMYFIIMLLLRLVISKLALTLLLS